MRRRGNESVLCDSSFANKMKFQPRESFMFIRICLCEVEFHGLTKYAAECSSFLYVHENVCTWKLRNYIMQNSRSNNQ